MTKQALVHGVFMRTGGGLCLALALPLLAAAPAAAQVSADELLFIYGPGQPPMNLVESGDQALIDRFSAQGYLVRLRQDDDPGMVQDAQAAAIIYISETVASSHVPGTFAAQGVSLWSLARPILCAEPYLYDDLRMTGSDQTRTTPDTAGQNGGVDNGDHGNLPDHHSMNVVLPAHPLAAGLAAGTRRFAATDVPMGFGMPGPGAQVVARCASDHPWQQNQSPSPPLDQRAVLFVYEQGAALWDGSPAPARRVGLQGRHAAANEYDATGLSVLDAAVAYTGGLKRIAGGSAWTNAGAWFPPGLPGANDAVLVVGAGTVSVAASATVRRLTVSTGVTLDVTGGGLTVSEDALVRGTLLARGGLTRLLGETAVLSGGRLELRSGGVVRLGSSTCRVEGALVTAGGTIEGDGSSRADLRVTTGTLTADGLTFRNGDAEGLHVQAGATITRLRGVAFSGVAPGSGSRLLTIEQPTLNLSAPGCTFDAVTANQANVRLVDTQTSTAGDVVLNLEQRATSGAGAGPAREVEVGGATINWVHAAPDFTAGVATGLAQTAWDLDTFADFAMYAPFRDVDGAGTDRIYALDPDGDGSDLGYRFDVPASRGDLVGYPWWDKLGGARVLWVVTTGGWVLRYRDQGAASSADPVMAAQISQSGAVSFTTPPITDASYVYAAGLAGNGQPRLFAMRLSDGGLAWSLALSHPISSELATELQDGVTKVFAGGQQPGGSTTLISQDFSNRWNTAPFSFQTGLFAPSGNGGDESGTVTGGAIRVRLRDGDDLSAGYRASFNVSGAPLAVEVSFRYRLYFDGDFDTGEEARALCAVDGALQGVGGDPWLHRFQGSSASRFDDQDSGWQPHTFSLSLADGAHTLDLGGTVNRSDDNSEYAYMYFDDVVVRALYSSGIVYRIDTQTRLVDADNRSAAGPVIAAPYPAFGTGLFVADGTGRVLGIDHATMNDLPGWPITPDATAVLGNVWLDWSSGRLYWGNEAGRVFGYDTGGVALPGFPRTPMGGAAIRGGGLVSGGVLWIGDRDGRLVALDASTGATISPDYRLGAGVVVGQVSEGFVGRPTVTTSAGKVLVVHPITDPSP